MWPVLGVAAILMLTLTVQSDVVKLTESTTNQGETEAIATNLVIYGRYTATYAIAHPNVQGPVTDAAINAPYWIVRTPFVATYVSNGRGYAYYTGPAIPALVGQLVQQTQMGMNVGTVVGGTLNVPQLGVSTSIPLPPQIPNGSVVVTN
ncbi:type IV pilus biogenesis protein PilM [Burkholderia vietnamiensis]|uniref:type IV pilus biogenesis protein PilM n=1 Tax=Burkholderia vietnamiensis TaxID=60552 RepID=UPI0015940BCC|nr:type IV pilus biogenesis protein PilM [Burkholderia vietnamiensis]MCA8270711.1 type IV pilus biogenesis protein PilM [Burkholderia vietnamiensis]